MLIDHIGFVFYPEQLAFRVVGRLSFPIFAFFIAEGYIHTSSLKRYGYRLAVFALISQIPYLLVFEYLQLNIFFTLLFSLVCIYSIEQKRYLLTLSILATAYIVPVSYGVFGVLLPASYYFLRNNKGYLLSIQTLLTLVYSLSIQVLFQVTSVLATPLIWITQRVHLPISINKYWFYWFYPAHLLFLYIMSQL